MTTTDPKIEQKRQSETPSENGQEGVRKASGLSDICFADLRPIQTLRRMTDARSTRRALGLSLAAKGRAVGEVHPNGHGGQAFTKQSVSMWEHRGMKKKYRMTDYTREAYQLVVSHAIAQATDGRVQVKAKVSGGCISVWGQSSGIIATTLYWRHAMKRTRADLKIELLSKAELLIDELLDWNEQTKQPNLTQIEVIVLKLRKQLGEQMALAVIDDQETKRPTAGACCPQCQREMHYKDMKDNTVESRVGTLPLERGYYYCQTCRTGLFPPRPTTGTVG